MINRKYLSLLILFNLSIIVSAQDIKARTVSISYIGEMFTHPGLKPGLDYSLIKWPAVIENRKGEKNSINKNLLIRPTLGFIYHRRYQTGLLLYRNRHIPGKLKKEELLDLILVPTINFTLPLSLIFWYEELPANT